MHIGLIASPFISVPPPAYGGTELFVATLAEALLRLGIEVTVYTNGESTVGSQISWLYATHEWPLPSELSGILKEIDHNSWAIADSERRCDIIHVNSTLAVPLSRLSSKPFVCTLHHPFVPDLYQLYERYDRVRYVSISEHQSLAHANIDCRTIYHGIDLKHYQFCDKKQPYLCFLGRICPIKGTHNAIEIAKRAGIPLKIAGEVQPIFKDYFESRVSPHIDGKNVEFIGEVGFALKNELLRNAMALLFPIEWEEPFGLAMIEAMACGTPVIAFPGGAVEEIVVNGVTGRVCDSVQEAVVSLHEEVFSPSRIRKCTESRFSAEAMAHRYLQLYAELLDESAPDPNLDAEAAA